MRFVRTVVPTMMLILATRLWAGGNPIEDVKLTPPEPIPDNSGKYYCPYTSDEVLAEWTDKIVKLKAGQAIGSAAGQAAAQAAGSGGAGSLFSALGKSAGRKKALEAVGGWEGIKATSDLSFKTLDDLCVYVYAKYKDNEHYDHAVSALKTLYPDLENGFSMRVYAAKKKAYKAGQ